MINLLPPPMKAELRAARTNVVLRRYLVTSGLALGAILLVFGSSFYINYMNLENYKAQLEESKASIASLSSVRKKTTEYNENLEAAKQIFASEIRLSRLVSKISATLPPGSILGNVSLNLQSLTQPISIVAYVDSFEKAGVLKRNFEDSGLFQSVTLKNVAGSGGTATSGGEGQPATTAYSFTVNLDTTLAPNATKEKQAAATGAKP